MDYRNFKTVLIISFIAQVLGIFSLLAYNTNHDPNVLVRDGHIFLFLINTVIGFILVPNLWRALNAWMHRTPSKIHTSFRDAFRQSFDKLYNR